MLPYQTYTEASIWTVGESFRQSQSFGMMPLWYIEDASDFEVLHGTWSNFDATIV